MTKSFKYALDLSCLIPQCKLISSDYYPRTPRARRHSWTLQRFMEGILLCVRRRHCQIVVMQLTNLLRRVGGVMPKTEPEEEAQKKNEASKIK